MKSITKLFVIAGLLLALLAPVRSSAQSLDQWWESVTGTYFQTAAWKVTWQYPYTYYNAGMSTTAYVFYQFLVNGNWTTEQSYTILQHTYPPPFADTISKSVNFCMPEQVTRPQGATWAMWRVNITSILYWQDMFGIPHNITETWWSTYSTYHYP